MSQSIPDISGSSANPKRNSFQTGEEKTSYGFGSERRRADRKKTSWPVFLFLTGLVVPWAIPIGPLRMSVYRITLLVMIAPCINLWISGKAGRLRITDIALLLFCFWGALSFTVNNGLASTIQSSGISFIETAGAYLLARCCIRDPEDFYNMTQLLFRMVVFLLPFAIIECVTGQNVLYDLFVAIMPTPSNDSGEMMRGSLTRAHLVFEHPILFGVCTSSVFALTHLVLGYQNSFCRRNWRTGIVGAATFTSLSAGPLIFIAIAAFLLSWNSLLATIKVRWKILIGLLVSTYVSVAAIANRSALDIATSFFVFDSESYWFRKVIWDYGSESVMKHPLFGVGQNPWERPNWMPFSIDNFWLGIAVSHGLPATGLILLAIVSLFLSISFKRGLNGKLLSYRTAFLITIVGFCTVLSTVTLWDAAYVLFFFLLGSGVWILDAAKGDVHLGRKQVSWTLREASP